MDSRIDAGFFSTEATEGVDVLRLSYDDEKFKYKISKRTYSFVLFRELREVALLSLHLCTIINNF